MTYEVQSRLAESAVQVRPKTGVTGPPSDSYPYHIWTTIPGNKGPGQTIY